MELTGKIDQTLIYGRTDTGRLSSLKKMVATELPGQWDSHSVDQWFVGRGT